MGDAQESGQLPEILEEHYQKIMQDFLGKVSWLNSKQKSFPWCLFGCIYLDIAFRGFAADVFGNEEIFIRGKPPFFDIGGSAIWVGRHLFKKHGCKSFLISFGGGREDDFSSSFIKKRVEGEPWISASHLSGGEHPTPKSAVTALLDQQSGLVTMLTYLGDLEDLGWENMGEHVHKYLDQEDGLLYLSGYFKTKMYDDLVLNLRRLSPNTMVCIDTGRLAREWVHPTAVRGLESAFAEKIIDVYLCTPRELFRYVNFDTAEAYVEPSNTQAAYMILKNLAGEGTLPPVTVVRDPWLAGSIQVFIIIGGEVIPIDYVTNRKNRGIVSPSRSGFNADFMYFLTNEKPIRKGDSWKDAVQQIINAAKHALAQWYEPEA